MKKRITYFAMSLSLLIAYIAVPITAHSVSAETTTTTVKQEDSIRTTESTTHDSATEVESAEDKAARPARITEYKKQLKETLTTAAKTRIEGRCVAAQALLKVKKSNNYSVHTARTDAYDKILSKLQELSATASAKGVDVTLLQTNITELQAKIAAFKTANTPYQLALTDLLAIDCKTDPIAFKAALEAARTKQTDVYNASQAIRTYLKETVKPTLITIKKALESEE